MSILSKITGIHWNLRPLAAPAGAVLGGLVGGPMGAALGAGLFKTADNKAHGDSWTHALEQGALNGGLAYGAGALGARLGGGGAQIPGVQTTPSAAMIPGPDGAMMNASLSVPSVSSPVGQSVMSRVMGGAQDAGKFLMNHQGLVQGAGSAAQGVLNAQAQNKQLGIEQQQANAQAAQIQAAIDLQKQRQAAFGAMLNSFNPMAGRTTPSVTGSKSSTQQGVMDRVLGKSAPKASMDVRPDPDPNDPNQTIPTPNDPNQNGGTNAPPTTPRPFNPQFIPPPMSPYAGNDSIYGSPYGYGYTQLYNGGY